MLEYASVQKWFSYKEETSKPYAEGTKLVYLQQMKKWCRLLNKNPDGLAHVSSDEALKLQVQLDILMREKSHNKDYTIIGQLDALHVFWRANGVPLTREIKGFKGSLSLQRLVKAGRSVKARRTVKARRAAKSKPE